MEINNIGIIQEYQVNKKGKKLDICSDSHFLNRNDLVTVYRNDNSKVYLAGKTALSLAVHNVINNLSYKDSITDCWVHDLVRDFVPCMAHKKCIVVYWHKNNKLIATCHVDKKFCKIDKYLRKSQYQQVTIDDAMQCNNIPDKLLLID
jgi:hypothetical protein